ncbi:hypothetical protein HNR77_003795 [Paenibacillus sp. JGP012]|uniref:hypothetical protein n=1 Tax=Paenibacillus sp. JGP012 TaxID=2735914 RepID=UPI001621BD2F|nr:hypothetical protein [Paenibacillus sp. JGP012]MBB6022696.1 hypothetical protein [Paenibacillus sp. JGP012]
MSDLEYEMEQEAPTREEHSLESWGALGTAERRVLGVLFHKHAGQSFSSLLPPEVWAKEGLSGAEANLAFAMLRRKRWISSVHKSWGECTYYIPQSHLIVLTLVCTDFTNHMVEAMNEPVMRVICEAKPHVAAELLHLVAWIEREALPLTSKGTIHKRSVQKLSTLTILSPADFEDLNIAYEHADLYPVHVVILLDMLVCLNLVQQTNKGLEIRQERLQQWISLSWSEMHREIFQVCMERYGGSQPVMQHFRYQLALLAPGLNGWYRIRNEQDHTKIKSWLVALAGWGFGEVGETADGALAFRWLMNPAELMDIRRSARSVEADVVRLHARVESEETFARVYVQPDFEVMVPPDVSPEVCWGLEHYCERMTRDQMTIYRLCKERVEKAESIAGGQKGQSAVQFLEKYSYGRLPEHVMAALADWPRDCETETTKQTQTQKQDTVSLVEKVGLNSIHKSPSFVYRPDAQGLLQGRMKTGMTAGPNAASLHHMEGVEQEEPSWSLRKTDVPETWHREWRKYHVSTARQIALQAIEWQVKLGVRKGEDTFVLIPQHVKGHERWTLEAWCLLDSGELVCTTEWRTFTPEGWDTMRLILPDHV